MTKGRSDNFGTGNNVDVKLLYSLMGATYMWYGTLGSAGERDFDIRQGQRKELRFVRRK